MTQVTITSGPPPTTARRGRKTGETYELFMGLPLDQWATLTLPDGQAATAASSTLRTIARREGVRLSILTDREDECLLHVLKTSDANISTETPAKI